MVATDTSTFGWAWATLRPDLVALLGLALAPLVAAHVLLNKRDVGSAIGWIGLAFLSPLLGAVLYVLFGVNRVSRRARRLRDASGSSPSNTKPPPPTLPEHLQLLARAGQTITGQPALAGNVIRMLRNGEEAYPEMLAAIEAASASVGLTTYMLRNDALGSKFIDALALAHRRGVQVRVILDAVGSGYILSAAYHRLRREGVPVHRFMHSPLPWRMPFLNLRTHKKLLVVDGRVSFIGGLNIGADNLASAPSRNLVRDTHFRLDGPTSGQFVADFAEDWSFLSDEDLSGAVWYPEIQPSSSAIARAVASGPDQDVEKIEVVMLQALASARTSVRVMTPYFLPTEIVVTALVMASIRGVEVDLVLPERSNHLYVDWATRAHIKPLLENGVRVWRNPPPFDHSKLMVVDGEWCFVGSSNLDTRSLRLNFELNCEIYRSDLARQVDDFICSRKLGKLTAAELEQRWTVTQLRDSLVRLTLPYI